MSDSYTSAVSRSHIQLEGVEDVLGFSVDVEARTRTRCHGQTDSLSLLVEAINNPEITVGEVDE